MLLAAQLQGGYCFLVQPSSSMALCVLLTPGQPALHQLHTHVQPGPQVVAGACGAGVNVFISGFRVHLTSCSAQLLLRLGCMLVRQDTV